MHALWLPVFLVNLLRGRTRTIFAVGRSPKDAFSDIIMTPTDRGRRERLSSAVWPTMRNGFLRPPDLTEMLLLFRTRNGTNLHYGRRVVKAHNLYTHTHMHAHFYLATAGKWQLTWLNLLRLVFALTAGNDANYANPIKNAYGQQVTPVGKIMEHYSRTVNRDSFPFFNTNFLPYFEITQNPR